MIRTLTLAATLAATAAHADIVEVEARGGVMEVAHELRLAVSEAGATVFAEVPHSEGAASLGMELNDATLLIFGNPRLGTPAMQDDMRAGLFLPLRVLVYSDDDATAPSGLRFDRRGEGTLDAEASLTNDASGRLVEATTSKR